MVGKGIIPDPDIVDYTDFSKHCMPPGSSFSQPFALISMMEEKIEQDQATSADHLPLSTIFPWFITKETHYAIVHNTEYRWNELLKSFIARERNGKISLDALALSETQYLKIRTRTLYAAAFRAIHLYTHREKVKNACLLSPLQDYFALPSDICLIDPTFFEKRTPSDAISHNIY